MDTFLAADPVAVFKLALAVSAGLSIGSLVPFAIVAAAGWVGIHLA